MRNKEREGESGRKRSYIVKGKGIMESGLSALQAVDYPS